MSTAIPAAEISRAKAAYVYTRHNNEVFVNCLCPSVSVKRLIDFSVCVRLSLYYFTLWAQYSHHNMLLNKIGFKKISKIWFPFKEGENQSYFKDVATSLGRLLSETQHFCSRCLLLAVGFLP